MSIKSLYKNVDKMISDLEGRIDEAQALLDTLQERIDAMSEKVLEGERGQETQRKAEAVEIMIEHLGEAKERLEDARGALAEWEG
jgi:uncharacterized protein YukE